MTNTTCPGCNGPATPLLPSAQLGSVVRCGRCGGVFTTEAVEPAVAAAVVPYGWCDCADQQAASARTLYYDMDVLDPSQPHGYYRRHGWFDPKCRGITQTG